MNSINGIIRETIDLSKKSKDPETSKKFLNIASDVQDYSKKVSNNCHKLLEINKGILTIASKLSECGDEVDDLFNILSHIVETNNDVVNDLISGNEVKHWGENVK